MGNTWLVTGGAGFIGSNFIYYILKKYNDIKIVNLDALTYAGNLGNLKDLDGDLRHIFVEGNICDFELVKGLFEKYNFDTVINFAAESHVDRSIVNPQIFLETNILGTQTLLDVARFCWSIYPEDKYCNIYKEGVKFVQISTDEVYGDLGDTGLFTEETPLSPNSPYSASKASADFIVRSYFKTYNTPVNITRCSNNYGSYQFPEKLIPLIIHNALQNKKVPIYGDGLQVRDWLYVEDHCTAIDSVIKKGIIGEVYNIGGNNEKTNIHIARIILESLDKDESLIEHVTDRLGHDRRYAIDNTKITTQLGFSPEFTFEEGIKKTIEWYLQNPAWTKEVSLHK